MIWSVLRPATSRLEAVLRSRRTRRCPLVSVRLAVFRRDPFFGVGGFGGRENGEGSVPIEENGGIPPRVLGIDPGLNTTGYGVLELAVGGPKLCEAGIVRGRDRRSLTARVADRRTRRDSRSTA